VVRVICAAIATRAIVGVSPRSRIARAEVTIAARVRQPMDALLVDGTRGRVQGDTSATFPFPFPFPFASQRSRS
jgi:hypothetical protein